ncbi:citrate/2-methylcitrate synthase, partial [Frankia tisae]|uniref:citrate/2-methylcitrate synthase n=2 Tax=Frankia tisae TaxID=2950104 RepID=UPI0027E33D13
LWGRLAGGPGDPAAVACLDRALGLLADHDLAVSTFAARVAASARADPYAVVSAGLAALDGPLHGGASRLAYRLLAEVVDRGDAVLVVSEYLRAGQPIPGFGHGLYPDGDPRARALLAAITALPAAEPLLAAAREIARAAGRERALRPNVDLALAVLTLAAGMPAEAGEVIFAVARTVGWLAHALEEYQETPLRLRPRGVYAGPPVSAVPASGTSVNETPVSRAQSADSPAD